MQVWSMDFMHDVLAYRRKFRTLNIIDDYNREAVAIEAEHSLSSHRVQLLDRITHEYGKPQQFKLITARNGPAGSLGSGAREKALLSNISSRASRCRTPTSNGQPHLQAGRT